MFEVECGCCGGRVLGWTVDVETLESGSVAVRWHCFGGHDGLLMTGRCATRRGV